MPFGQAYSINKAAKSTSKPTTCTTHSKHGHGYKQHTSHSNLHKNSLFNWSYMIFIQFFYHRYYWNKSINIYKRGHWCSFCFIPTWIKHEGSHTKLIKQKIIIIDNVEENV